MSSTTISTLLDRLRPFIPNDNNDKDVETNANTRHELLLLSRQLTNALSGPVGIVQELAMSPVHATFVRLAIDIGIFEKLSLVAPEALTKKQLADQCGAEEALVWRVGRLLVTLGFADDAGQGGTAFVANDVTKHMTRPNAVAGCKVYFDTGLSVMAEAPTFFKQNNYRLPTGIRDGLFQYAHKTDLDCYSYWSQTGAMENFNTFAQGGYFGVSSTVIKASDWFPFDQICQQPDASKGEYALVDVGGSHGYQTRDILNKHPHLQGRFLLQDLPQVIEDIDRSKEELHPRVETMGYNFFEPQPVKGAKVYMLNSILHNWNDGVCRTILSNIKSAMVPGYSTILVGDAIVPEKNVPLVFAGVDAWMLLAHGGAERNPAQWVQLMESVGLRVVKIWPSPGAGRGVVQVELPATP